MKLLLVLLAGTTISLVIMIDMAARVTPAVNTYTTSWIGNTFGGGEKWVQIHIGGMYVAPDATVYTNSPWDEGGSGGRNL